MSSDRTRRIDEGLSSLVEALLTSPLAEEDDEEADARHDSALDLARSIIQSGLTPSVAPDVGHVGDLIKTKLIRDNKTPDKALRFSNLYSRLLTQPVLHKKWAILYLLHQLAGSGETSSRADTAEAHEQAKSSGTTPLDDAFSPLGLHALPTREARIRSPIESQPDPLKWRRPSGTDNGTTKADLLRAKYPPQEPSEITLLRDLPFTLQGLSSKHLTITNETKLIIPPSLPLPLVSLIHCLAEPSLLYRSLSDFVQTTDVNVGGGLVGQSLRAAIGEELRGYLSLVAGLESEIRRALGTIDSHEESSNNVRKVGVSLKRCMIWTREATMGLRLMSLMVEESRSKKGGELITAIHGFSTSHGDPFVHTFARRLLTFVTRPFYDMLRQWIYDGELSDPFLEFFVKEQSETFIEARNDRRGHASSVWQDKYKIDDTMIPSIITTEFANKVFLIGKSLNFIRYGCEDSEWVEGYSTASTKELRYEDTAALEQNIDEAYATTMQRLMHLMNDKFKLMDHLYALKKFLLLGQGDFIALLMESLSSSLDRPANTLYRHNLTAQLEHAIRGSNAQYESQDVLRRLDARMLELSHGEIGWDVFTLEYKIDAPVDVVVTSYSSREYLKVFNFLWRIKRVEFALGSAWKRYMTGARGILNNVSDKVGGDWKVARCIIAEMIHFISQLQYYILFQVIESSWDKLYQTTQKPNCTLDDLISAHKLYLTSITRKGLMAGASKSKTSEESFLSQLHQLLKVMLQYKDAMDGLYGYSVAEFTKRQSTSARIETRTAKGKWGITEQDDSTDGVTSPTPRSGHKRNESEDSTYNISYDDDQILPNLRARLRTLAAEFQARNAVLLGDLATQPDMDMRFLGVMISFNDFYVVSRKKGKTIVERRDAQGKQDETVTA